MQQFPDILRHWRTQRRFSQLDLALEANVSARHISFLETGRARPSREMIIRLGDTLGIPLNVRNQMLTTVGFAPTYQRRDWQDEAMDPIRKAINWTLEQHAPYPGIAIDNLWVIQRMNKPAARLFGVMGAAEGTSMLDLIKRPDVKDNICNWPEVAYHSALRLRSESASQGGIPELDAAADELAKDAVAAAPDMPVIPTIFNLGGQQLALFGTIAQFGTTSDQSIEDLKIELFFPANPDAEKLLRAANQP